MITRCCELQKRNHRRSFVTPINYLETLVNNGIQRSKKNYKAEVVGVVSDNASNMVKLRRSTAEGTSITEYGCSAHSLELLAKDLKTPLTKIVTVAKLLRNGHLPQAWLKVSEGST